MEARSQVAVAGREGGGLRSLVASLKDLRGYGDEIGGLVKSMVGTMRLMNPLYLLMVLGSALGVGLVVVALVIAILMLVL